MRIITAKQARKNTDRFIDYDILEAVEYLMKEIKGNSKCGASCVSFIKDYTNIEIYKQMKDQRFIAFIESLGYKYRLINEEDNIGYYEEIEISW